MLLYISSLFEDNVEQSVCVDFHDTHPLTRTVHGKASGSAKSCCKSFCRFIFGNFFSFLLGII